MRWSLLILSGLLALSVSCKKNQKDEVDPLLPGKDTQDKLPDPEHLALFMYDYGGVLVPIACWNDETKSVQSQGACINLLPAEQQQARLGAGKVINVGAEQPVVCEASGDEAYGLATDYNLGDAHKTDYGVWPSDGRGRVKHIKINPTVTPEIKQQLKAHVIAGNAKLKGRPLKVFQAARADVDGDGKADRLYSVAIDFKPKDEQEAPGYAFSGLLVTWGASGKTQILDKSGWDEFRVIATADLDKDKKRELLLYTYYYEGEAMQLVRWNGTELETIGGWGCGA